MHIHVPDGVFPLWLWLSGIIVLIPLLALAIYFVKKDTKKLVISSAITGLMLIVFSIELFGYHLNFTALSGMILGPWWSLLSITMVNFFLAMFGHGGITVAPINILINWVEAIAGFLIYRLILIKIKNKDIKSSLSGITVFISLALSYFLFIGVIALTGINPAFQIEGSIVGYVPLKEFAIISAIPALISAIAESILTSFMMIFIEKVKPGMLK